jgi:GrpB-like predicted nucleotidyltransferase (UPF0157 family)
VSAFTAAKNLEDYREGHFCRKEHPLKINGFKRGQMSISTNLDKLAGNWTGVSHLWLAPDQTARVSDSTASVAVIAQGKYLSFRYTWADESLPQEGLLLVGLEGQDNLVRAVWIDSWYMGGKLMFCDGGIDSLGGLSLQGSYAAPPGQNWGWRITIEPGEGNTLDLCMVNIHPEGKEELAVKANYHAKPRVEIVPYKNSWPSEFHAIAAILRQGLGDSALRIDHIGSTSVPGLAAKDVIDIQITVPALDQKILVAMQAISYTQREGNWRDHRPAHMEGPDTDWEKWLFEPPSGQRRTHTHMRVNGRPNQRYPLLFRDYLRTHPSTAESYAELKRCLAQKLADPLTYPDVKDPAVDLIYLAAEEWATTINWQPGPSDE